MNQSNEAENVFREMKETGLVPDVVTYTTLIDAFKRVGNFDRCWELFGEVRHSQLNGEEVDE